MQLCYSNNFSVHKAIETLTGMPYRQILVPNKFTQPGVPYFTGILICSQTVK